MANKHFGGYGRGRPAPATSQPNNDYQSSVGGGGMDQMQSMGGGGGQRAGDYENHSNNSYDRQGSNNSNRGFGANRNDRDGGGGFGGQQRGGGGFGANRQDYNDRGGGYSDRGGGNRGGGFSNDRTRSGPERDQYGGGFGGGNRDDNSYGGYRGGQTNNSDGRRDNYGHDNRFGGNERAPADQSFQGRPQGNRSAFGGAQSQQSDGYNEGGGGASFGNSRRGDYRGGFGGGGRGGGSTFSGGDHQQRNFDGGGGRDRDGSSSTFSGGQNRFGAQRQQDGSNRFEQRPPQSNGFGVRQDGPREGGRGVFGGPKPAFGGGDNSTERPGFAGGFGSAPRQNDDGGTPPRFGRQNGGGGFSASRNDSRGGFSGGGGGGGGGFAHRSHDADNVGGGRPSAFGTRPGGGGFNAVNLHGMDDHAEGTEFGRKPRATHIPKEEDVEVLYERDREVNLASLVAKMSMNEENKVKVTGVNEQDKVLYETFHDADLPEQLLKNVVEGCQFVYTTPIQKHSMHLLSVGYDILGHASTGSGKTAAFLVPIIKNIMNSGEKSEPGCPVALIIAPTRELAQQTADHARKFVKDTGVTSAKLYGQTAVTESLAEVRRGCDILTATIGRLRDFVGRGEVRFSRLRFLVLDEADELLKNNFKDEIMEMLNDRDEKRQFPTVDKRQTMLYSATFGADIQALAREILKPKYAFVSIGELTSANSAIKQNFLQVRRFEKMTKLLELLQNELNEATSQGKQLRRTLIFVNTKKQTDTVAAYLCMQEIKATSIHGDRQQNQRQEALNDLINGRVSVLVGTDVVARGIDIRYLEHVIVFDLPKEPESYVHRIGRTGRIGHLGESTSFVDPDNPDDIAYAPTLVAAIRSADQEVPQFILDMAGEYSGGGGGGGGGGFANVASSGGGGFAKPMTGGGGGFAKPGGAFASGGGGAFSGGFGSKTGFASKPQPKQDDESWG